MALGCLIFLSVVWYLYEKSALLDLNFRGNFLFYELFVEVQLKYHGAL